jgi:hypothetical protein
MRIQFEIKEKLPEIIEEIMNSGKWQTSVKEELSGRTTVVIRDQAYGSEATMPNPLRLKPHGQSTPTVYLSLTILYGVNITGLIVAYWNKYSYQPLPLRKACLILT